MKSLSYDILLGKGFFLKSTPELFVLKVDAANKPKSLHCLRGLKCENQSDSSVEYEAIHSHRGKPTSGSKNPATRNMHVIIIL
jgi:hypothetical protein